MAAGWRQDSSAECQQISQVGHRPRSCSLGVHPGHAGLSCRLSAGPWMTSRSTAHSLRISCTCRFWPRQCLKMPMCSVFSLCLPCRSRTGQLRPPLLVCPLIPVPACDRVGSLSRSLAFHLCLCHSDIFYWTQITELMTLPKTREEGHMVRGMGQTFAGQ